MLARFKQFIQANRLFLSEDKVLLAVSGGADSVVMAHLFKQAGIPFSVAHCNFSLRGTESDAEEAFVKKLAASFGADFYAKKFDTEKYAADRKQSIQEAARDLRYDWFEQIRRELKLSCICTAHHADDSMETFFVNLIRGTGIDGLSGIPLRNNQIRRPLLFASRQDILNFAEQEHISYCNDSSNASDAYLRNRIRHSLVPLLEQLSPAFRKTIQNEMQYLGDASEVINGFQNRLKAQVIQSDGTGYFILRKDLKEWKPLRFYVYSCLKDFGFKETTVTSLVEFLEENTGTGKMFHSSTHDLYVERDRLLIRKKTGTSDEKEYLLEKTKAVFNLPFSFSTDIFPHTKEFVPTSLPSEAFLDAGKLDFPLLLRKWKAGDRFQPLGMKGSKLLSDFFTDGHFSKSMKDNAWVLVSRGEIAWVVGHRIDERFKLEPSSQEVFCTHVG
ncbi:MAG TPA: tRNA lysidine(34) synthetase TilS [Bacteroidia bacterium]|jgi:tRNA(Ile)-lysidine synthase|nr:tRNA lysidine(34) synthetase TilS [Bacteroidia bacterium]